MWSQPLIDKGHRGRIDGHVDVDFAFVGAVAKEGRNPFDPFTTLPPPLPPQRIEIKTVATCIHRIQPDHHPPPASKYGASCYEAYAR